MKYVYAVALCVLFSMSSLPAFAQETPVDTTSPLSPETVESGLQPEIDSIEPDINTSGTDQSTDITELEISNVDESTIINDFEVAIEESPHADESTNNNFATNNETSTTAITDRPEIYITEINWAGSALSTADEWLELYNPTSQSVDLGGWLLAGAATGGESLMLPEGTAIDAKSTLLIANYASGNAKSTLAIETQLVSSALSIPNTKLEIYLSKPNGTVIDSIVDSGTPDAGSTVPFTSMQRNLQTLTWETAAESINLTDATQFGSPGTISLSTATVANDIETPKVEVITSETVTEKSTTEIIETTEETIKEVENSATSSGETNTTIDDSSNVENENDDVTSEIATEISVESLAEETPIIIDSEVISEIQVDTTIISESEVAEILSFSTGSLLINEFVSNPAEGVEWIEIYNPGLETIELNGWLVADSTGSKTPFTASVIEPGLYALIENPKGKLNNDGDSIYLYDPSGNAIDFVNYGDALLAIKGESVARMSDGNLTITATITKGEPNIYEQEISTGVATESEAVVISANNGSDDIQNESATISDSQQNSASTDSNVSAQTKTTRIVAVAEKQTEKNTKNASGTKSNSKSTAKSSAITTITGTITVEPGLFGEQIAYMEGVQLYFYYADWPELKIGDVVSIKGEKSSNRGEARIKINKQSDITVTDRVEIEPKITSINEALNMETGTLVQITGTILSRDGDTLVISDDTGSLAVIAHANTNISWASLTHSQVQITGVLRQMGDEIKLFPRSPIDIVEIENNATTDDLIPTISGVASDSNTPWIGMGLLLVSMSTLIYWFLRARKLQSSLKPLNT